MHRGRCCSGLLLACALGCETSPAAPAETSSPAESSGSTGTVGSSEGTTFAGPSPCTASSDCESGFCVAPYDAGAGTGPAGMGTPSCVPECVPPDALDRWCLDDAACCDGSVCDRRDGFCIALGGSSEETIGESWSTDSSGSGASSSETGGSSSGDASSSSSAG